MPSCQVAIIGAGPYGVSVAAHLRSMGAELRVFGEPMEFWQRQMPLGMVLRSPKFASSIAGPSRCLRLEDYAASKRVEISDHVRLEDFIEYGRWFQQQAVADVDRRKVAQLDAAPSGFRLILEDGDPFEVERV